MKKIKQLGLAPFDASDYLDSEETIVEYLSAALENPEFKLTLVSPSASKIKEQVFSNHTRVEPIDKKFEDWIVEGVELLAKTAKAYNTKFEADEKEIKEGKKKIEELEARVRDYENKQQDWTGSGISLNTPSNFIIDNTSNADLGGALGDTRKFEVTGGSRPLTDIFSNTVNYQPVTCPNCARVFSVNDAINGNCPHCGKDLGFA